MNDKAVELLEQYDIDVIRTRKGRGSILCDTDKGCCVLKEYTGSVEHAQVQDILLRTIAKKGMVKTEQIIPTKEGQLLVKDTDEISYVLKTWQDGRECGVYDKNECVQAVSLLSQLHKSMELEEDIPCLPIAYSPLCEYEKHNREIKRVKKYLKQKGQKQMFEIQLLNICDYFLEQALEMTEEWRRYETVFRKKAAKESAECSVQFCHGDYQYHNIIMCQSGWFVMNFEKFVRDNPIRDLYLLLRKLLEKTNWSVSLGTELLQAYEKENKISAESRIDLYYRLAYPEKFWKIVNYYFNSGKAWIPGKNQEKLEKLIEQEKNKQQFLKEIFQDVSYLRK